MIIVNVAVYHFETQSTFRITSTFALLVAQLLTVAILSEIFCFACGKKTTSADSSEASDAKHSRDAQLISHNEMESGLVKYVFSMHMYTAAATKIGAAGLGWIDPRYIAQLALRGRYQEGGAYPLEAALIHI